MADILFIHGAWYGGWCWTQVRGILHGYGHRIHAAELADEATAAPASLSAYVERVVAAAAFGDRIWLVGHSMGGGVMTQAAERLAERIDGLIYLAAVLPRDGEAIVHDLKPDSLLAQRIVIDEAGGVIILPHSSARECLFHRCDDAALAFAMERLSTEQPLGPVTDIVRLSDERFGRLAKYYIECLDDRALPIAQQRLVQQRSSFRQVVTLDADHSPFLSCPAELAAAIDAIVRSVRISAAPPP